MSNNQPNPRWIEILAEEMNKNPYRVWRPDENLVSKNETLSAMQRAVEEAENALIAKYQNMEDELEQLRIELERIQKYVVHKRDCDIVTYKTMFGGMNPKKIDCTCGLEGGGDNIFNYWKQRCLLAERYLEESPCDPDITIEQSKAWNAYIEFINQNKK